MKELLGAPNRTLGDVKVFPLIDKIHRRFRKPVYAAATFLGVSGVAATCGGSESPDKTASIDPVRTEAAQSLDPYRFLKYPVPRDERFRIQQGWEYSFASKKKHLGIDYIMGKVDDSDSGWKIFPVMAAADGEACVNPINREGTAVFIRHDRPGGKIHYTYYGHLSEVKSDIPQCKQDDKWYTKLKHVEQGEGIGKAGASGVVDLKGNPQPKWVHLHFGVIGPDGVNVDAYDIRSTRDKYPDLLFNNNLTCGDKTLWVICPTGKQAEIVPTMALVPTMAPVPTVEVPQIPTVELKKDGEGIDFSLQDSSGKLVDISEDARFANKPILVFYYGRKFDASDSDLEVIKRIKGEFTDLAIMPVLVEKQSYSIQLLKPIFGEVFIDESNVQTEASIALRVQGYPATIILDQGHKIILLKNGKLHEPDVVQIRDTARALEYR